MYSYEGGLDEAEAEAKAEAVLAGMAAYRRSLVLKRSLGLR